MDVSGAQREGAAGRVLRLADVVRLGEAQAAVRRAGWTDLLQVTAEQAASLVGAAGTVVTSVLDDGGRVVRAAAGRGVVAAADRLRPRDVESAVHEVVSTGRPLLAADGTVVVPLLGDHASVAVLLVLPPVGGGFDALDLELVQQVCRVTAHRLQVGQTAADAEVLREALLGSLDEGVMITRGPEQRVTMVSPLLAATLAVSPEEMDGRPVSLRGWSWLDEDGSLRPAEDMPTWQAYRTGQPVIGETMRIVPADGDVGAGADEDPTRWVVVSAQPVVDPLRGVVDAVVTRVRDVTATHRVALARREEADRMRAAQQVAGLAWSTYDPIAQQLDWSDEMYRIAGLDPDGERIDARRFLAMVHPDDREVFEPVDAIVQGRLHRLVRYRIVRPDGQVRSLQAWTDEQRDDDGRLLMLHGAALDVTEHERTLTEVVERRRQFEMAFDGAPYGMLVVSSSPSSLGRVLRANRALATLVERPLESVGGRVEDLLVAPADDDAVPLDHGRLAAAGRDGHRLVRRVVRSDGVVRNVWVTVIPVHGSSVSEPFLVVHVLDVTSQSNQQRTLERIALTDAVTGLANRSMVTVRVDQALASDERPIVLMMLDLDRFKMVNDSLGHQVGDLLLVAVADRLRTHAPPGALVGRLGGDEFVLLVQGEQAGGFEDLAAQVVRVLGRPYELSSGHRVVTSASVGVAAVHEQSPTRMDLLRDADLALYRAKELGRNRYVICDDELLARAEQRVQDEQRLRDGLDGGRLRLHLQPLHDLATGRLRALEALVRLEDPELGLLGPDRFVPIAEETGLVAEIDHWMIDAALRVVRTDPRFALDPELRVAVNVSGRTLERSDFVARLNACPRPARRRPAPARDRDHRDLPARRRRRHPGHPASAARPRDHRVHRRLRHRLLGAVVPADLPGRRAQGRPGVRRRAGVTGRAGPRDPDRDHHDGARAGPGGRGRGRGDRRPARHPGLARVRLGAGLALRPPGASAPGTGRPGRAAARPVRAAPAGPRSVSRSASARRRPTGPGRRSPRRARPAAPAAACGRRRARPRAGRPARPGRSARSSAPASAGPGRRPGRPAAAWPSAPAPPARRAPPGRRTSRRPSGPGSTRPAGRTPRPAAGPPPRPTPGCGGPPPAAAGPGRGGAGARAPASAGSAAGRAPPTR